MPTPEYSIEPVAAGQREAALRMALDELNAEQQAAVVASLLPLSQRGVNPLGALFALVHRGKLCGAAWVQPQIGNLGTLWLGGLASHPPEGHVVALLDAALASADRAGLALVQTLVDPLANDWGHYLRGAGLTRAAMLNYLEWQVGWLLPQLESPDLTYQVAASRPTAEFYQVLDATYQDTLDCPALTGLRSTADTLEGYRSSGDYDPQLWLMVRAGDADAGVLLLTPNDELDQWELTYLGIVPQFRGRGWGRSLVARAQNLAARAHVERIVLAADAANRPALAMYERQGFRHWADRVAWIRARGAQAPA